MDYPTLSKAPLVEVIFELYWQLQQPQNGQPEMNYGILAGRLFEKLKVEYPFHEPLPAASMPTEMAGYLIQHRFRTGDNEWPLIQVGPGLVTLNQVKDGFERGTFHRGIEKLVATLLEIYTENRRPRFNRLMMRYIDAVDFDYQSENISDYIARTLKTDLAVSSALFVDTGISAAPTSLDTTFYFNSENPRGQLRLRFGKGRRDDRDLLRWESIVEATGDEVPQETDGITQWAGDADELIHKVFFRMIEGEMKERFK
ncbi:MAG: TIGR04255 family protein [Candidatus Coatesbacteria bacterium]|nr:TIGR04255 family protein [Candidatus Coatesbacteria bacterium]